MAKNDSQILGASQTDNNTPNIHQNIEKRTTVVDASWDASHMYDYVQTNNSLPFKTTTWVNTYDGVYNNKLVERVKPSEVPTGSAKTISDSLDPRKGHSFDDKKS